MGYRRRVGARTNWLFSLALVGTLASPAGCTLARRQVMLVLTTDMECTVFDRFEVRLLRGSNPDVLWTRTYLRNDCPAIGESIPRAPLARGNSSGDPEVPYRLGVVDARRTDERIRIEVVARRTDAQVTTTSVETDFVDGQIYAVPLSLAGVCLAPLTCPAGFVCRRDAAGSAACGSVYRTPGTLGTFTMASALRTDDDATLTDDGS
jgi:hypothetical protein